MKNDMMKSDENWGESFFEEVHKRKCNHEYELLNHPAYIEGYNDAIDAFCHKVDQILGGDFNESGVSNEPWESTKKRLIMTWKILDWLEKCDELPR